MLQKDPTWLHELCDFLFIYFLFFLCVCVCVCVWLCEESGITTAMDSLKPHPTEPYKRFTDSTPL